MQERVTWFTTMVGKKGTLKQTRALLHAHRVPAVRATEFVQARARCTGAAAPPSACMHCTHAQVSSWGGCEVPARDALAGQQRLLAAHLRALTA